MQYRFLTGHAVSRLLASVLKKFMTVKYSTDHTRNDRNTETVLVHQL